jgi:hypothetical protein
MTTVRDGYSPYIEPGQTSPFTATRLNDGTVLISGGADANGAALTSAEIYNPPTGSFTATGSMTYPRENHTATLLTSGKVLIDGGNNQTNPPVADELYDPTAGTFALTGVPLEARSWGSAIRLNGGAVLTFGGFEPFNGPFEDAELYNPNTGTFTGLNPGTSNLLPRVNGTATLLKNGLVLIAGGTDAFDCRGGSLNTAVAFNPKTKAFVNLPNMVADRDLTTATLLPNGKVLIAGGTSYQLICNGKPTTFAYHGSAELFDPKMRTFTATGALAEARAAHTATLLSNGLVLFAGGYNTPATCTVAPCSSNLNAVGYSELYNLVTGTFSQTGSLNEGRSGPIAAPLANRQVLVAGGLGYAGALLTSAELFSY